MSSPVHQTQSDHTGPPPSAGRRHRLAQLAALVALIGSVGISALVLRVVVSDPVSVVLMFALVFLVAFFGWLVLTRRSRMRLLGLPVIVFGLVGLGAFAYDHKVALPALIGVFALFGLAARYAVRHSRMTEELAGRHARPANPARKGVLIINPKSGGGKAERFNLPTEARQRGVEPLLLEPGKDLCELADRAVTQGAARYWDGGRRRVTGAGGEGGDAS